MDEVTFEKEKVRLDLKSKKITSLGVKKNPDSVQSNFVEKVAYKFRQNFIGRVKFDGNKVLFEHADIYIYCTTTDFSRSLMESFGCDTCVKITNPFMFYSYISNFFSKKYNRKSGFDWGVCRYIHPVLSVDPECPEYLMKKYTYAHQKEFRFCWIPYEKKGTHDLVKYDRSVKNIDNRKSFKRIKPIIATIPALSKYCELII
jgi:hypothetical protein